MKSTSLDVIRSLQKRPRQIRNVCILAHVDHGKTTLADSLLASNGIISNRMAGKLRYLDSRPDEQERGITMKSSAVALLHKYQGEPHLINLIDSPGHVDFAGEVSAAVRLSDGAYIVVDVVEGVCPQTSALLKQAWIDHIKPVLVLNKIDRLIEELKLTPQEAYKKLQTVLEQVNVIAGEYFVSTVMQQHDKADAENGLAENLGSNGATEPTEDDWDRVESTLYFVPENGNVIFASALDGWAFRLSDFAKLFFSRTGVKAAILEKTLWGDFYLDTKEKRMRKGAWAKGKKPLFVQLILENIWAVYDAVLNQKDRSALEKITGALNLSLAAKDLRQQDARVLLKALFVQWLPLSECVLSAGCEKLPSPADLPGEKVERLLCTATHPRFADLPAGIQALKSHFEACCADGHDSPTIAFISKMVCIEKDRLPQHRAKQLTPEEMRETRERLLQAREKNGDQIEEKLLTTESPARKAVTFSGSEKEELIFCPSEPVKAEEPNIEDSMVFVAFARVYSGSLRTGDKLYVLPPAYDPASRQQESNCQPEQVEIGDLFVLMGRDLELVPSVPAGNVCGIQGLSEHILKSGTLSTTLECPAFANLQQSISDPIVRVAIEPAFPKDLPLLRKGLKLLNQSDPSVRTFIQETGEHVLVTAGEVHLQRCLEDLRERFSRVEINVSEPIIPFMETIIERSNCVQNATELEASAIMKKPPTISISTANGQCTFKFRALPIPQCILDVMLKYEAVLTSFEQGGTALPEDWTHFGEELAKSFEMTEKDSFWRTLNLCQLYSFGSRRAKFNLLINCVKDFDCASQFAAVQSERTDDELRRNFEHSVVHGFQLCTSSGNLCNEPLRGVALVMEQWELNCDDVGLEAEKEDKPCHHGPLSGQIIATVKDGCKWALQAQPQRLMVAMYSCVIQAPIEVLGRVHSVIGRRYGRVVGEEMEESSNIFQVSAVLPVVESFGFADEIRKRTSGLAWPQLVFSHWEVLEIDPFWVPTTEEELEHYGVIADTENTGRKYMNAVRRRKGLKIEEQIVVSGSKQSTRKQK